MIGYSVADANRRCQPEHRGEELFRLEGYGGGSPSPPEITRGYIAP